MLGELRNVVKDESVRVSDNVVLALLSIWLHTGYNLSDGVLELGMTTEFLSLLCVLILICHIVVLVVVSGGRSGALILKFI